MKKLLAIVAAGTVVLVVAAGCSGGGYKAHPFKDAPDIDSHPLLEIINTKRAETQQCGEETITLGADAQKLEWSQTLYAIAYEHTLDMNKSGIIHDNGAGSGKQSDYTAQVQNLGRGSTHSERVRNNDYHPVHIKEIATGDNNATHVSTVQAIITYWLSDPEKCKKIMDANVTEFGMAHIHDDQSEHKDYWTIDLAKPAPEDTWL